ncbi:methyltransferase [Cellulomonas massiliensis]|uniref:methyltransferase n=1 Tax=Cellulomonas massiliensis TaxID=1465811 RepID=UPI000305DE9B|nr:methyltransferase [Cellulomonas massiliensis]
MTFLGGLDDVVRDEIAEVLQPRRAPVRAPGRDDAWLVEHAGALSDVRRLRTAVAVFEVLDFDVPRPRSLASGEHLRRLVDAAYRSLRVAGSSTFRFEAAGSDSAAFARLAQEVRTATGLLHDPEHGELVLRVRRGPARPAARRGAEAPDPGWQVLVRTGPRPLSARPWRVADYPGALNATIAAAMVRLGGVAEGDRVLNLMCGSGTLLVERLLAGPAAAAAGVDLDETALEAARANLEAAGVHRRARLQAVDATDAEAVRAAVGEEPFDLVLADPPWGTLHGEHATNEALHAALLRSARALTAPGGRLVLVTHEVRAMARVLDAAASLWRPRSELRVFAKGHHPRVHVLDRV